MTYRPIQISFMRIGTGMVTGLARVRAEAIGGLSAMRGHLRAASI